MASNKRAGGANEPMPKMSAVDEGTRDKKSQLDVEDTRFDRKSGRRQSQYYKQGHQDEITIELTKDLI